MEWLSYESEEVGVQEFFPFCLRNSSGGWFSLNGEVIGVTGQIWQQFCNTMVLAVSNTFNTVSCDPTLGFFIGQDYGIYVTVWWFIIIKRQ